MPNFSQEKQADQTRLHGAIIDRINELMRVRGWSIPELAARSEVSVRTLHYVFQNRNITLYTLACLCRGFEITMQEFFNSDDLIAFTSDDI